MARKIIPLKYNKSPLKFEQNWGTNTAANFLDMGTLGAFNLSSMGKSSLEGQFDTAKDNLMGTKVDQNFYKDLVNPYAGLTDKMAGLENTAEDLTVNQKQFTQQNRALQRSLSTTLEQSKKTGTYNAQVVANSLTTATGDMAAGVGEQERQNQLAKAGQASELQKLKAQSAQQLDMQQRQGEYQVDMQMRKGEEDALGRDLNKQQAILGLLSGEIAREDAEKKANKGWLSKVFNIF